MEAPEIILAVQDLYKRYGKIQVLNGLCLEIEAGQIFGLVGENGAGKTTAIRIIVGLLKRDRGSICICGQDVDRYGQEVRRHIGYVPDSFGVYDNLKVEEYMQFYAAANGMEGLLARRRIGEVLETVHLLGKEQMYVTKLSKSMKQRLCIARALLHQPKLLIMDEPTAGLDVRNRYELKELFQNITAGGSSVLISSHAIMELAGYCTDFGLMADGYMLEQASVAEYRKQTEANRPIRLEVMEQTEKTDQSEKTELAMEALRQLPFVKTLSSSGNQLFVTINGDQREENQMLQKLVEQDVPVVSFGRDRASLETYLLERLSRLREERIK